MNHVLQVWKTRWLYDISQAKGFFLDLRSASIEILRKWGVHTSQGWKSYKSWKTDTGKPDGILEHYTAGVSLVGSARHLNSQKNKNSSCQFLIGDRMLPEVAEVYSSFDNLKDLPCVVIMLCDFNDIIPPCFHGGWVNRKVVGIENRNAGLLKGKEGDWRWWPKGWKAKFPHEKLGKTPVQFGGKWWEPYTYEQVKANVILGQYLYCLYHNLDPRWVIPHHATSKGKFDTGPMFPLHDVRHAIFSQTPVDALPWLQSYQQAPNEFMMDYDEEVIDLFIEHALDEGRDFGSFDNDEIIEKPVLDLEQLIDDGGWKEDLPLVRQVLTMLGYCPGYSYETELDKDTALAVYIFQRAHDLKADKVPGKATKTALYKRAKMFGLGDFS